MLPELEAPWGGRPGCAWGRCGRLFWMAAVPRPVGFDQCLMRVV